MKSQNLKFGIILMLAAMATLQCSDMGKDPLEVNDPPNTDTISYATQIQPIFTANCAVSGCHIGPSPAAGLRLNSYAMLIQGSVNGAVVMPFEPDNSILIQQLEGTRQPQMPFGQAPLSDSLIQRIRDWIHQGASDN